MTSFIMNNNIELTKFQHFKKCIDLERKDDPCHLMWVGEITEEFLEGVSMTVADGDWGSSDATRYMIRAAIREFYADFDSNMYYSFGHPRGLFTDIVWGKFRALERKWQINHKANLDGMALEDRADSVDPTTIFQSHIVSTLKNALIRNENERDRVTRHKCIKIPIPSARVSWEDDEK